MAVVVLRFFLAVVSLVGATADPSALASSLSSVSLIDSPLFRLVLVPPAIES